MSYRIKSSIKKSTPRSTFFLKPLSIALALASGGISLPVLASWIDNFATMPPQMQSIPAALPSAKHNVMVLVGNGGGWTGGSISALQREMVDLLNSNGTLSNGIQIAYKDAFNWDVISTHSENNYDAQNNKLNAMHTYWNQKYRDQIDISPTAPRFKPFGQSGDGAIERINSLPANGNSSPELLARYLDSIAILKHSFQYRCQKGYVIALTQTNAISTSLVRMDTSRANATIHGYRPEQGYYLWYTWYYGNDNPTPEYYDKAGQYRYAGKSSFFLTPTNIGQYSRIFDTDSKRGPKKPLVELFVNGEWGYRAASARFISDAAFNMDFRPTKYTGIGSNDEFLEKYGSRDKEGKNWDDPVFDSKQNIKTFVITDSRAKYTRDVYQAMATPDSKNKTFFTVGENGTSFRSAFQKIIENILAESPAAIAAATGVTAPAVGGFSQERIPSMAATVRLDLQTGSSELLFHSLNNKGDVTAGSSATAPDFSQRKVLARINGQNYWLRNASGSLRDALNNEIWGISSRRSSEWSSALVPWLTRMGNSDAKIAAHDLNSQLYRERIDKKLEDNSTMNTRNMGDIVGAPVLSFSNLLLTAANDGLVYIFKKDSDNKYSLQLNYMPASMPKGNGTMMQSVKTIANAGYVSGRVPHEYLLNGGIVARQTPDGERFMAGNMGQGGRGMYMLNLKALQDSQNENDIKNNVPMREFTNNSLGYTIGSPQIGRYKDSKYANGRQAVFVGSGVNNPNSDDSALFIVFPQGNGNDDITIPVPQAKGGLMQPTLVDTDYDGKIDIAYVADVYGGLYRIDLREDTASHQNRNRATKIFQAAANQKVISAPAVLRLKQNQYVVVMGTGSDIFESDLNDKNTQSIYGIYDDVENLTPEEISRNDLLAQTMTTVGTRRSVSQNGKVEDKDNKMTLMDASGSLKYKGWYLDFNDTKGERILAKPEMLLKTVLFTTRNYQLSGPKSTGQVDACYPSKARFYSGDSWLMQIDAKTGGGNITGKGYGQVCFDSNDASSSATCTGTTPFNGKKLTGVGSFTSTTSDRFVTPNSDTSSEIKKACTISGDCGDSGAEVENMTPPDTDSAFCAPEKDNNLYVVDGSGTTPKRYGVHMQACENKGVRLRQLSWREIY